MYAYIICIILVLLVLYYQDVIFGGVTTDNFEVIPKTCSSLTGCTSATMNPYFNRKASDRRFPPSYSMLNKGITGSIGKNIVDPLPIQVGEHQMLKLQKRSSGKPNPYALPIQVGTRNSTHREDPYYSNNNARPLGVTYGEVTATRGILSPTNKQSGVLPVEVGERVSHVYTTARADKQSGVLPVAVGKRQSSVQKAIYNVLESVPLGKRGGGIRSYYETPSYAKATVKALGVSFAQTIKNSGLVDNTSLMPEPLGTVWMRNKSQKPLIDQTKLKSTPLPIGMRETPKPTKPPAYRPPAARALPVQVKESFGTKNAGTYRKVNNQSFIRPTLTKDQRLVRKTIENQLQNLMENDLSKAQAQRMADDTLSKDAQMTWARDIVRTKGGLNNPGVPMGVARAYPKKKETELVLNRQTWGWDKPSFMY